MIGSTLLVLALLAQAPADAADRPYYSQGEASALFDEASTAYARGEYTRAIELYERLLSHGRGSPDVLYNLGTASLAEGELGRAAHALERARMAGDRNDDLAAQLDFLRSRQLDRVMGAEGESLPLRVANATPPEAVGFGFLTAYLAVAGLAAFRAWKGKGRWRVWAPLLGAPAVLAVILGTVLLCHVYAAHSVEQAVAMAPVLPVRPVPQPDSSPAFEIHAGLKVRVLERVGGFSRIKLGNGLTGWVSSEGLSPL